MKILGGFDERYAGGTGHEDKDFVDRVGKLGLQKIINDDVSVIHQWHPIVYNLKANSGHMRGYKRNRNLFSKTCREKGYSINNSYDNFK